MVVSTSARPEWVLMGDQSSREAGTRPEAAAGRVTRAGPQGTPGTMTTAVLYAPHDLRIEMRPVPSPSHSEVLVRILSVGVCGSDVHYYEQGHIGNFVVRSPLVLGHESSGQIVEVGKGVSQARVGERVAIEPGEARSEERRVGKEWRSREYAEGEK